MSSTRNYFYGYADDPEGPFGTKWKRKMFVSNVFMIVSGMLAVASVMAFLPFMHDNIAEFFYRAALPIIICSLIIFMMASYMIYCFKGCRQNKICGSILLVLLTVSLSFILAIQSSRYRVEVVAMAFGTTVLITGGIAAIARYAPCDITGCGIVLLILSLCLMLYGIVVTFFMIFHPIPILHTIYAGLAVILYTLFLWYDLQLIMGGRKFELETDEYVLASAMIFTDVIMIFYYLITLIGAANQ